MQKVQINTLKSLKGVLGKFSNYFRRGQLYYSQMFKQSPMISDYIQNQQNSSSPITLQVLPVPATLRPIFSIIINDHSKANWRKLIEAKSLISRQLPKMPRPYITKLLFDTTHETLLAHNQEGQIMGCLTFRTFPEKDFAEIVFLAVEAKFRDRRVGSQIMDKLKQKVQKRGVRVLLTYADNTAIGFFRKQGFQTTVETAACNWSGYIKVYLEGTLMKCEIFEGVSYTKHSQIIKGNRASILAKAHSFPTFLISSNTLHHALQVHSNRNIQIIPGVLEATWSSAQERQLQQEGEFTLTLQQLATVQALRQLSEASIFRGLKELPMTAVQTEQLETLPSIQKKIISGRNFRSIADTCRAIENMAKTYEKYLQKGTPEAQMAREFQKKMASSLNCLHERQLTIQIEPLFKDKQRPYKKKQTGRPKPAKHTPSK